MTKNRSTAADTLAAFDAVKAGQTLDAMQDMQDAKADPADLIGPVQMPQDLTDAKAVAAYLARVKADAKAARDAIKADAKAKADAAKAARDAARDAARATKAATQVDDAKAKADKIAADAALLSSLVPVWGELFAAHGGHEPRGMCKAIRAVALNWTHDRAMFVKAGALNGIDPTTLGVQWAQAKRT